MLHRSIVLLLLLAAALPLLGDAQLGGAPQVPLPLFPANNWWNTDVSAAPVDGNSAAFINFIGADTNSHPDFGGNYLDGTIGIPFIVVEGSQPKRSVELLYWDESDGYDFDTEEPFPFYPIPDEAITEFGWIEGGPPGNVDEDGDRHILIVDRTNNHLYELFDMYHDGSGWTGGSGAFFDMNTNDRRPEGWTSADAAGLAILPGLVRYDEVYGPDDIRHAFRVTVEETNGHIYPASHTAGDSAGALPMGARLRLKASFDISEYPPEIQKIFRAMKKYGLIVADNGSNLYVSGTYDTRWDNDILNPAFHDLEASDFEVIQLGWAPPVALVLSMPANVGAGDASTVTLTARNVDDEIVTNYTGTVQFTSTDGAATLPLNYTFTTGDAGTHTFDAGVVLRTPGSQVVTVKDLANATITGSAGVRVGPATPANVVASASSTTQIGISWNPSAGATEYEVSRRATGGDWTVIGTPSTTSFPDTGVTAGNAYVYRVRALDASDRVSGFSAADVATTVAFTNEPLVAGSTAIKAAHLVELRQAANALRALAGLSPFGFADSSVTTSLLVKGVHVTQLRDAITAARATLDLSTSSFTDVSLSGLRVKAVHFQQLRGAVQ